MSAPHERTGNPVESWAVSASASPFAPLNLRRNPFGEPPPEDLPDLVVADVATMVDWLETPRRALQIIGEGGRGKTARLQALRAAFPGAPYVYLAEGAPIPELPVAGRLLLDEAQRLPTRSRRGLFRSLASLALSTHRDLTAELERAGWRVWTLTVRGLDGATLGRILDRRLEWARLGQGPLPRPSGAALEGLLSRFGDDLRAMFDHLYEVYQGPDAGRLFTRGG